MAQLWPIQNEIKVGSEFVKHIISTYGLLEKHAITDRRLISFDLNNGASERSQARNNEERGSGPRERSVEGRGEQRK